MTFFQCSESDIFTVRILVQKFTLCGMEICETEKFRNKCDET